MNSGGGVPAGRIPGTGLMVSTLSVQYRRWFEYEKDSHAKVLECLLDLPHSTRTAAAYQKAIVLFAHIIEARRLWLFRFGARSDAPTEFFPKGLTPEELVPRLKAMETAWAGYLARLDETEIAREFEYRSLEGGYFRNQIQDILAQLFGHSWYHRGQIASLIRSLGYDPPATDFVFWTREPLRQT